MTTISVVMRRFYSPSIFDDLTLVPHTRVPRDPETNLTTFVFDGELDPATVDAIWSRMESRDDADQTRRAALRAAAAALPEGDDLRLTICYLLGDQ